MPSHKTTVRKRSKTSGLLFIKPVHSRYPSQQQPTSIARMVLDGLSASVVLRMINSPHSADAETDSSVTVGKQPHLMPRVRNSLVSGRLYFDSED
jgi:hypothetical protein